MERFQKPGMGFIVDARLLFFRFFYFHRTKISFSFSIIKCKREEDKND